MIVTYIFSHAASDHYRTQIRFRNLADALNRTGFHHANLLNLNDFILQTPEAREKCAEADLLIIYRDLYDEIFQPLLYWKARDKKVIVEFDQALNLFEPEHPEYAFWMEKRNAPDPNMAPTRLEEFKWGLGMVDAAIVPSTRLANDWLQYADIYEIPDYINTSQYPGLATAHENQIWLGFGQRTSVISIQKSGLAGALEEICAENPQVHILCYDKSDGLNALPGGNKSRIEKRTPQNFNEWVDGLMMLDIGLFPIAGEYDLRLSRSILLEFMMAKIPWITSKKSFFPSFTRYGIRTKNTSAAWKDAITNTIHELSSYKQDAAGAPFLFALGMDAGANLNKTLQVYADVLNRH